MCYIFSLFVLLLFLSSFSGDLTVVRIVEIEKFTKHSDISSSRGFLYDSVAWRFLLMYFSSKFLLISLLRFWRLSSLLFLSLGFIILGSSYLLFLGYLTPSCERFLNYLRKGRNIL